MVFENFRINIPRRGYRVQVGEGGITCSLTSHPRTPVRVHLPTSVSHESGPLLEILGSPFLQGGGDQRQLPLLRATGGSGSRRPRAESGENQRENHPSPPPRSIVFSSFDPRVPTWVERSRASRAWICARAGTESDDRWDFETFLGIEGSANPWALHCATCGSSFLDEYRPGNRTYLTISVPSIFRAEGRGTNR